MKTPAGAIVTGKPVMVGTGLCNVLTKVIIPKKQLRKDRVTRHEIKHESKDFKQTKILPTTLFKPDGKKRATKPRLTCGNVQPIIKTLFDLVYITY